MQRGLEIVKESGASMSPFLSRDDDSLPVPTDPDDANSVGTLTQKNLWSGLPLTKTLMITTWDHTSLRSRAALLLSRLYRLACVVGARGTVSDIRDFVWTIRMASRGFAQGTVSGIGDGDIVIRNGYCDGLTSDELYTLCVGSREGLVRFNAELQRIAWELRDSSQSKGFTVLSRAMRAKHPGVVFARAAACGEVDLLTDIDSRLFVGLPVTASE